MLDGVEKVNAVSGLIDGCYNGGAIGFASAEPIVFVEGYPCHCGLLPFVKRGATLRPFARSP